MEKLKALFSNMANDIAAFFGADTTEQIDQQDINEVLDYLESMGYDLKGYGFITEDKTEADIDEDDADSQYLDEEQGIIRYSDGDTVADATSMFISTYLISDNYAYTLKNDNLATQSDANNWFEKIIAGVGTATYKIYNAIYGPILDAIGVTNATVETWGKGLITIYYDDGIGVKGSAVNDESLWNWDNVFIDAEKKVLSIKRHSLFNNNAALEFSLDGWTGRYSMPLEFLLSVHIATMKPDLAYDMATSFSTNVNIYLHATTSGNATAAYEVNGKYITWSDIQEEIDIMGESNNWFKAFINWFDNLHDSGDELAAVKELGIDIGTGSGECTCTIQTVYFDASGENVLVKNDDNTFSYANDDNTAGELYDGTIEDGTVQEVTEVTEWCDYCRSKFSAIKKYLSEYNDYHYQAYIPYIASVTDHWYRDVYFVLDNDKDGDGVPDGFVEYDYDYQTVMNERWTLYETDDNGEYVLYLLDDDGNTTSTKMTDFLEEKGYASQEEAEDAGYAFVKKAETVASSDVDALTDLGWSNENDTGVWTAYTVKETTTSSGFERAYEDDELDEVTTDDIEQEVLSKIYINVATTGNITQTGEGQRTETNSSIKKMFLQNNYFTYDGTTNTANIIEALRNDNDLGYGAVSDSDLEKTAEYDSETYTVKDYVSTVSLEQDSLDAFSMLENTHTLDADYIYRDFKELIVELGYFTKEELTDETPQLLQWLVPETGSAGFPNNTLDKNENEFGTMIHSKGDIDASAEFTLSAAIEAAVGDDTTADPVGNATSTQSTTSSFTDTLASIGIVIPDDQEFITLGSTSTSSSSTSLLSLEEWWEECAAMMDEFTLHSWAYKQDHSYGSFESARDAGAYWVDCSLFASWALQKLGVLEDGQTFASGLATGSGLDSTEIAQKILDAGAEVIVYGGKSIGSEDNLEPGDVIFYDGHVSIYYGDGQCYDAGSDYWNNESEPITYGSLLSRSCNVVVRFPFGNTKSSGSPYEGYSGNEAVVSPVTGILLEYGTYTTEVDSVSGEEYRVNTDLKYATDGSESETVSDKVGYAKILVLDAENYKKLESTTSNSWKNNSLLSTTSKVDSDGNTVVSAYYKDDPLDDESELESWADDWSDLDKTVYGYKQFAEEYEAAGIAGYIIYIDGFSCELVDEEFTEEQLEESVPNGEAIDLSTFKTITESNIGSEDSLQSLYEQDDTYKLASQKATDKANAEAAVKVAASSSIYTDGLIFIKEGTVLGRTITDYELVTEYRNEDYDTYMTYEKVDEETGETEEVSRIIGNYLRIEMFDTDSSIVENVEDYMKLDEGDSSSVDLDYEFFFWSPYEGGAWGSYESYISGYSDTSTRDSVGSGPTIIEVDGDTKVSSVTWSIAVGIAQWTNNSNGLNNLAGLCEYLSEYDSALSSLADYANKDAEFFNTNLQAFKDDWYNICKTEEGYNIMLEAQMSYVYEKEWLDSDTALYKEIAEWAQERPMALQGFIFSVMNWGNYDYNGGKLLDCVVSSKDDETLLKDLASACLGYANSIGATSERWDSQAQFCQDLMDGKVTEEQLQEWLETKNISDISPGYGEGVEWPGWE